MISIYVNDNKLDLYDNIDINLNLNIDDILDPTAILNNYTKTIIVPGTINNKKIFSYIDNLNKTYNDNISEFYPYKKTEFKLFNDDYLLFSGYLKLSNITKNIDNTTDFEINLFGEIGLFFTSFEYETFRDLSFPEITTTGLQSTDSDLNFIINKEEILNHWQNNRIDITNIPSNDIRNVITFMNADNGLHPNFDNKKVEFNNANIYLENMKIWDQNILAYQTAQEYNEHYLRSYRSYQQRPAVWCNYIFDKIIKSKGYTYSGDFFNKDNPYWNNVVIPLTDDRIKYVDDGVANEVFTDLSHTVNDYLFALPYGVYEGSYFLDLPNPNGIDISHIKDNIFYINGIVKFKFKTNYNLIDDTNEFSSSIRLSLDYILYDENGVELSNSLNEYYDAEAETYQGNIECVFDFINQVNDSTIQKYDDGKIRKFYYISLGNDIYSDNVVSFSSAIDPTVYPELGNNNFVFCGTNSNTNILQCSYNQFVTLKNYPTAKYLKLRVNIKNDRNYKVVNSTGYHDCYLYVYQTEYTGSVFTQKNSINYNKVLKMQEIRSLCNVNKYNLLPNIKQIDFLKHYLKIFNLYITVDKLDNKKLNIQSRDEFFKNYKFLNWSNKIDYSKEININPLNFSDKYLDLSYKDSKLYLNNLYKNTYDYEYSNVKIDTNYEFNNNSKKILNTNFIAPVIFRENNTLYNNINNDIILSGPNTNQNYINFSGYFLNNFSNRLCPAFFKTLDKKESSTVEPTIYFCNGLKTFDGELKLFGDFEIDENSEINYVDKNKIAYYVITDDTFNMMRTKTYYHNLRFMSKTQIEIGSFSDFYYDNRFNKDNFITSATIDNNKKGFAYLQFSEHFKDNYNFTHSLNISKPNEVYYDITDSQYNTGATLYSKFYKKFYDDRYNKNTKILTAYFNLTINDINNFEFNNIIFLNDNYYIVNKISDFNLVNQQTTKVELVKINDLNNYVEELKFTLNDGIDYMQLENDFIIR